MARYTQARLDTFETIQINAGVILNAFNVSTGAYDYENIIGATTGGNSFNSNPSYSDYFADVDNVPENTKQGKRIDSYDPALSTTFVTINNNLGRKLVGAADLVSGTVSQIIPRNYLEDGDFEDIWLVGDYSDKTGTYKGGYVAIHIKNALNTGGFQFQSTKNGKGQFSADFHGHYDIENIDDVPFEVYIRSGADEPAIVITTQPESQTVTAGTEARFTVAATSDSTIAYQWQVMTAGESSFVDTTGNAQTLVLNSSAVTEEASGNRYRCKLTTATDTIYSKIATLTVTSNGA